MSQVAQASAPRDPAPLVPAVAGEKAFGSDLEIVNVIIVIVLERLWQYFLISAVVPVLTATLLSFVVFAVPPNKLDTRLQTTTGLFLSLIAIQVSFRCDRGGKWRERERRRRRRVAAKKQNLSPDSFIFFHSTNTQKKNWRAVRYRRGPPQEQLRHSGKRFLSSLCVVKRKKRNSPRK